jgi:tetratricopeptide (TPR) repeat protein
MLNTTILALTLAFNLTVSGQSTSEQRLLAQEAISNSQKEVLANPSSAEAYYRLGQAYLAHWYSVADKAGDAFLQATHLKPDYAEAYYGLAIAYDRVHRHQMQEIHPQKEVEALKKAIELKPDYVDAFVQLARTYMWNETLPNLNLEKTYRPAVEILKKAVEITPDFGEAHRELARAYSVLKENERALSEFKQAIASKPDDPATYSSLDYYSAKLGELEGAIGIYKQVIEGDSENALAHKSIAKAYFATHKYQKTTEHYEQAIRIKPDDGESHYQLGCVYLLLGDKEAALAQHKSLEEIIEKTEDYLLKLSYQSKAVELIKKIQSDSPSGRRENDLVVRRNSCDLYVTGLDLNGW